MAGMTLDEVLTRHRVDLRPEDLVRELDDALSALPDVGVTPLSDRELGFLAEHGGPGVAEALQHDDGDHSGRERTRRATHRLVEAIGESLSIADAASALGVDRTRVSHRLRDGSLWSFTLGRQRRIPRWQILPDGRVLPGLAAVVAAIPAGIHPSTVAALMGTAQPELEDQTPVAYLAGGGDPTLVAEMLDGLARW